MKEVGRSVHSLDVIKKKSSSGCLIIKKKVKVVDGVNDSSSRNLFNSIKEKKRPRVTRTDSESSDEFTGRKIHKFHDGSGFTNGGFIENRESDAYKRAVNKYEFDEYDGFNERMNMKNDYNHRLNLHSRNRDQEDSGIGTSRRIFHDDRSANLGSKNTRFTHGIKNHYKMEDDEPRLPHSVYRQVSDEPIRLQGKNGVLKVMVKKHKPIHVSHQSSYKPLEPEPRPEFYKKKQPNVSFKNHDHWDAFNKKKTVTGSSLYSASKHPGKPVSSKKNEMESTDDDSDTSLPLKPSSVSVRHSVTEKTVKIEKRISPQTKNVTPVKGKESKVKRGTGTEKQLLREKIRSMLLSAGWTIDYRPRRNRDYLDAVYINPSGTAYWSIIKAYEALQKEEKDHSQVGGEFTPLPVETLSKLTRQTRKKIEREMKKKRRDEANSAEVGETTKRRLTEASQDSGDDSNDDHYKKTAKKRYFGVNAHMVHARKSNKFGGCTLLIRSEGKKTENDQFVPYSGKRTLLSWLIDSKTVQVNEKVHYMNRKKTRVMQEGWITKEGIHCGCCSKILTVLKFELHAGSKLRQPFLNIFVQSGQSLMQCLIDAWNKQGELEKKGFHGVDVNGDDPNDDTCGLCGDGGDLICCDGCPSTFHQNCLGIQMLPQGDWHCPNCSCKYCEMASTSVRTESALLVCYLCEKKYHESCSLEMDSKPINSTDPNLSFCGHKCVQLYKELQKVVGVKHELDSGFSWSLIKRSDISSDTDNLSSIELSQRVECNAKLAVALSVIDECFLPIADRRSGINLIHNVVYNCGSNFNRLNYSGFYTAILERGDELICAASIRIHGTQLAEMPFIGTRHIYRRQGMCRRLLSAIESALSRLHIEKLVIPAIAEHMHTWTDVFGFNSVEESHKQEMRSMNMLVFPGTDMLQKPLVSDKGSPLHKKTEKSQPNSNSNSNSNSCFDNDKEMVPNDSDSEDHLDDCVKKDTSLPVLDTKSEGDSDSDSDDTLMQNGEVGTDTIQAIKEHFDSIPAKTGNETTDQIANVDSKVKGFAVENENGKGNEKGNMNGNGNGIVNGNENENVNADSKVEGFAVGHENKNGNENENVNGNENENENENINVDSKVEGFTVENGNGNGKSSTEMSNVNSIPPQDPDTETAEKPKESDSKVEEFVVKEESEEKESVADSDSKNIQDESHVLNDAAIIFTGEEEREGEDK